MNRKERRAAQKQGKSGPVGAMPGATSTTLFAAAIQSFRTGRLADAERRCRDVLAVEPRHADALHLLGTIAFQANRPDTALELIGKSIAANDRNADSHFNIAQVFRRLGRTDDAIAHLAKAAALKPDHAAAHQQLGDLFLQQGRFGEAIAPYRRLLTLQPNHAESCNNLGIALAAQGQWDAAAAHYRRALALKPDLVDVYRNLGRVLLLQGHAAQALALARQALQIAQTDEIRAFFVQCATALPAAAMDQAGWDLIARALTEGWSRPSELSALAGDLFKHSAAGGAAMADSNGFETVAGDLLLRALLESAPVRDIALERFLTAARSALLERAVSADVSESTPQELLTLFCALTRQCFINEYCFAVSDDEIRKAQQVREMLVAALEAGAAVPVFWVVALAAYAPLHAFTQIDALLERAWPTAVAELMKQQVREPRQEQQLRPTIPVLTAIEDEVSQKVRRQYEDMPYPRWLKAAPTGPPVKPGWYLRHQFPYAPIRDLAAPQKLDVLIAGCGTGQHAIETGRRFADARVLAIDLSLTSLSYAARKTRELGLGNIEYAQADILKLGAIGRSFDLIESSGVLHHLADPAAGWRVLVSLLRAGGLMHIGLYSALARTDIRAVRAFIAERGYGDSADDIRRCRQELLACEDGTPLKNVTRFPDFFSTSECRDLLFHAQEHQLTIPAIKAFLSENNLTFIGFAGRPLQDYRTRFPEDKAATDLDRWHLLETEAPLTFVGMYQFWVQKL
jgi:tetratricopeptide (TPR) repeat protein/SAM-dependent methyltransferase